MIYWIASYPKSGSTWLRLFLAAYKNGILDINNPAGFTVDDVAPGNYQPHLRKPVNELTRTEMLFVRPAVLLEILHLAHGARVFCKTHNAYAVIDGLPLIPPILTEGAVYLVRDPRDVAVSYSKHCNVDVSQTIETMSNPQAVADTGRGTYHALFTWSQHAKSWLDEPGFNRHAVRYEDMVNKPEKTFAGIVQHLGWDMDERRMDAALEATAFERLQGQELASGFREASKASETPFFRAGQVGAWRNELSEAQVARIERDHGEVMTRLGYELET